MSSVSDIEMAIGLAANDPETFFGKDIDGVLKTWKIETHPDKWPNDEGRAKAWFTRFTELAEVARNPRRFDRYRIKRKIADGDLCEVLVGTESHTDVLVKLPTVKAASVMKTEMDNLAKIRSSANEQAKHLFPAPIGQIAGANVFEYAGDLESLASVAKRCPGGIDGRHIGWITKRLLLALTWAHSAGVVHGAVTPEHVLICKRNHGIVLCDWIHSGSPGSQIRLVPGKYKASYPDFAVSEKKLCWELDVIMAANLMRGLCDKNCPERIKVYLNAISRRNNIRDESAWALHEEFNGVLRQVYGAPKWVEFV